MVSLGRGYGSPYVRGAAVQSCLRAHGECRSGCPTIFTGEEAELAHEASAGGCSRSGFLSRDDDVGEEGENNNNELAALLAL